MNGEESCLLNQKVNFVTITQNGTSELPSWNRSESHSWTLQLVGPSIDELPRTTIFNAKTIGIFYAAVLPDRNKIVYESPDGVCFCGELVAGAMGITLYGDNMSVLTQNEKKLLIYFGWYGTCEESCSNFDLTNEDVRNKLYKVWQITDDNQFYIRFDATVDKNFDSIPNFQDFTELSGESPI